ncbi:MAG: protein kinase domain-containing protein [Planctomycetota bacterium]
MSNLVQVYDVGQEGGVNYVAVELVQGESLEALLRTSGPADYRRVTAIACQAVAALAALHGAGVVHGGVRPSNIILRPDGVVKVTDFAVDLLAENVGPTPNGEAAQKAVYSSQEQAGGGEAEERSDIYSLGVVIYQMLTGQPPFAGETAPQSIRADRERQLPDMTQIAEDVPPGLVATVRKCLARHPDDRYQTAESLAVDLDCVRLELEFEGLDGGTLPRGRSAAYSTRSVLALRAQREAKASLLRRGWRLLRALLPSLGRRAASRLAPDMAQLRRLAGEMQDILAELAQAKARSRELDQKAVELRERSEEASQRAREALEAGDGVRSEELREESAACAEAAAEFQATVEWLREKVGPLERSHRRVSEDHERLRIGVEVNQAQRTQRALERRAAGPDPRVKVVAALSVAVLVLGAIVSFGGPADGGSGGDRAARTTWKEFLTRGTDELTAMVPDGPGTGYFVPGAQDIAAADLDMDGFLDLSLAGGFSVAVLYGRGDGTFEDAARVEGAQADAICIADLDGRGLPDIVATSINLDVLYGGGGRRFSVWQDLADQVHSVPDGIWASDFDGDGRRDIAILDRNGRGFKVLYGQIDYRFGRRVTAGVGSYRVAAMAVGDFDGDAQADVAVADATEGCVRVLFGQVGGSFARPRDYAAGPNPEFLLCGDFTGDRREGLAAISRGNVAVLSFAQDRTCVRKDYELPFEDVPVAAASGGTPAMIVIAVEDSASGRYAALFGPVGSGFRRFTYHGEEFAHLGVAAGDFDVNGQVDFATTHRCYLSHKAAQTLATYVRVVLNPMRLADD